MGKEKAGLLFAFMFVKSGRLWMPIGFHFAWNFMLSTVFGLTVSGNEQVSVISVALGKNSLLLGGDYGPEGGLLVTGILLLCFLYIWLVVKPKGQKIWTMENDLPFTKEKSKK